MECNTSSVDQQQLFDQHVQLVTAVYGRARLQSLAERHAQEAASQFPHSPFQQLATMESNFDFNDDFYIGLKRTYSLQ
jgi:hypothetical protein